jgi:hypothetical protein
MPHRRAPWRVHANGYGLGNAIAEADRRTLAASLDAMDGQPMAAVGTIPAVRK